MFGLSSLLLYRQNKFPFDDQNLPLFPLLLAGILYGVTFFIFAVEGGMAILGIAMSGVMMVYGLLQHWHRIRHQPLLAFFLLGYAVALALIIFWGDIGRVFLNLVS